MKIFTLHLERSFMSKVLCAALLSIIFASPGTSQSAQPTATQAEKATVYVYSYKHIKTLTRVDPPVYLDGKVLAKLDGARYFIVKLDPGTHTFHLKDKKRGGLEMEFKAGETYYIRMEKSEGTIVHAAGLVLMPKENATFDMKQMRPINLSDIKDRSVVVTEYPPAQK
ncbi:MAG TPA: DUF2846 domain-containing protein [Pyrinomonadaceae bacterium]|jgi:hypothetical protein